MYYKFLNFLDSITFNTKRKIAKQLLPVYEQAYRECELRTAVSPCTLSDLESICKQYHVHSGLCNAYEHTTGTSIPIYIRRVYLEKTNSTGNGSTGQYFYCIPYFANDITHLLKCLQVRINLLKSWL